MPATETAVPLHVDLPVHGMSCAGCAGRIEKALRKADGVLQAGVNFATTTATVDFDPTRTNPEQLCEVVRQAGYDADVPAPDEDPGEAAGFVAAAELAQLRRDLLVVACLGVPVIVLAMAHGVEALQGAWSRWLQAVLTVGVLATGGRRFFRAAWVQLKHGTAAMDALIALGTATALLFSLLVTILPGVLGTDVMHPPVYFESAAAIILLILLGRFLEARARRRAGLAIERLLDLQPKLALVERSDEAVEVPVGQLRRGTVLRLRPGERVPADGEVIDGSSTLDESMLTGESAPIDKVAGSLVFAGTQNGAGTLRVRVTKPAAKSTLQQIVQLVKQAQGRKAKVSALADRVAAVFTPVVLVVALVTFVLWLLLGSGEGRVPQAIVAAVAVLIIACPCAMGLATPVAILVGTGRSAELGILWKGGDALELAAHVDTVVLDKTGTVTTGRMQLVGVTAVEGWGQDELLRLAASLERGSEHPLAAAVVAGAKGVKLTEPLGFQALAGAGVSGVVDDKAVLIGKQQLLEERGVDVAKLTAAATAAAARGQTPLFVAVDGAAAGLLAIADTPRPEAKAAVASLRALGLEVRLLTGDRREVAEAVAREVGIERVDAEVLPQDKQKVVVELMRQGRRVAMVGDGINDAPALAAATVGVAMGGGTDVAIEAADATLLRGDLGLVAVAVRVARATLRVVKGNLAWAFGYNVVAIPLAAGVMVGVTGWQLSPMVASAAMAMSSVSVVVNSLRLRRVG